MGMADVVVFIIILVIVFVPAWSGDPEVNAMLLGCSALQIKGEQVRKFPSDTPLTWSSQFPPPIEPVLLLTVASFSPSGDSVLQSTGRDKCCSHLRVGQPMVYILRTRRGAERKGQRWVDRWKRKESGV